MRLFFFNDLYDFQTYAGLSAPAAGCSASASANLSSNWSIIVASGELDIAGAQSSKQKVKNNIFKLTQKNTLLILE